jgi:hypothetical protein
VIHQATYEALENATDPDNEVFNPIADEESKSTTFGATMNFINAIVGAGIVGRCSVNVVNCVNTVKK